MHKLLETTSVRLSLVRRVMFCALSPHVSFLVENKVWFYEPSLSTTVQAGISSICKKTLLCCFEDPSAPEDGKTQNGVVVDPEVLYILDLF